MNIQRTARIFFFISVILLILLLTSQSSHGQELQMTNSTAIGLQISQYQNEFGTGISLTSPYFANKTAAIRVRGNLMFHEHIYDDETTWSPYFNSSLGVTGRTGTISDAIYLYGEGGVLGLFPSDKFSAESFDFGGYGLFGFEFYMSPRNSYFIEIGAVGTGARADENANDPLYSNGLTISAGFRAGL